MFELFEEGDTVIGALTVAPRMIDGMSLEEWTEKVKARAIRLRKERGLSLLPMSPERLQAIAEFTFPGSE